VISASTKDFNLWNYLVSTGVATSGVPGNWNVTIASGVVIGATTYPQNGFAPPPVILPAFDTGQFPAGSTLTITNNGKIVGAGGKGAETCPDIAALPGGPALRAQTAVTLMNNGSIWGGGGGGGKGFGLGGGGAGSDPGYGGRYYGFCFSPWGANGTLTTGGAGGTAAPTGGGAGGVGGGPGQPGSAGDASTSGGVTTPGTPGAAAGAAAIGNSFITWAVVGDRRGPLN